MSSLDHLKRHYVESIDWTEAQDGTLAFRFPMAEREIPTGAQLTVRETQVAIFLDEGKLADIFEAGRYTLTTRTLPELTRLKSWDPNFRSPFKSDVFFFSLREQIDQKWGTSSPVTIRDVELGPIRIRAHGTYSYRLENPKIFFQKLSGTTDRFTNDDLGGHLRGLVMSCIGAVFGNTSVAFIDMAANQQRFSEAIAAILRPRFKEYGLALEKFGVHGVSLPKEMQAHFDKAASMRMIGDVHRYLIFQAAESLTQTGSKSDTAAGLGVGLGLSLGKAIASETTEPARSSAVPPSQTPAPPAKAIAPAQDVMAMLTQLHELLKKGVLTQAEFEAKKAELLKKIG